MTEPSIRHADEDITFICGALRSGTTLLRLMIDGHPALSNPGEMDFLFEPPPVEGGSRDMKAYAREIALNRVFQKTALKVDAALGYEDQVRDFIRQLREPGKRLSINIHRHFDRAPAIFPNARYVHLLRDPRDVAKSSIGMGWAGNVYHGVDHWIASERDFERLAALVSPGQVLRMKNEDLVKEPERELTKLCAFLGVAYDASMLSYPSHTTYGPPDAKLVEQWRRELGPREIALIESKVASMLAPRGYELSGAPPISPGPLQRRFLRAHDRFGRWREQARRYGLFLALLSMAARRLGHKGLQAHVLERMAPIALKYVK